MTEKEIETFKEHLAAALLQHVDDEIKYYSECNELDVFDTDELNAAAAEITITL